MNKLVILILAAVFLSGCDRKDPACLDGYLVSPLDKNNGSWLVFCENLYAYESRIRGRNCHDLPGWGKGTKGNLVLKEGTFVKTKCYNTKQLNKGVENE